MPAGDPILAADYLGIRRATIDGILCRVRQSAAAIQSVASAVATPINFDVEDWDPYGLHSTSVNTSRITPVVPGYYEAKGGIFMGNATAVWDASIGKNGVSIQSGQRDTAGTAIQSGRLATGTVYCNGSTDYIEIIVNHTVGAPLSTNSSARFASWLEVKFLGRATNP